MRASKSEDALEQLNVQLMERDASLREQHSEVEALHTHNSKLNKEKAQAVAELSALKM